MIRSSVNLDCFISVSLKVTDSIHFWRKFRGSGHWNEVEAFAASKTKPILLPQAQVMLRDQRRNMEADESWQI